MHKLSEYEHVFISVKKTAAITIGNRDSRGVSYPLTCVQ